MKILMGADMPYFKEKEQLFSLGNRGGGSAVSAFLLAKALVKKGLKVDIIAPGIKRGSSLTDGVTIYWRPELVINFKNNFKVLGSVKTPLSYWRNRNIFKGIFKSGR